MFFCPFAVGLAESSGVIGLTPSAQSDDSAIHPLDKHFEAYAKALVQDLIIATIPRTLHLGHCCGIEAGADDPARPLDADPLSPCLCAGAGSTRVSNELGAGRGHMGAPIVRATALLGTVIPGFIAAFYIVFRRRLGPLFSIDESVQLAVASVIPVLAAMLLGDAWNCVLSGACVHRWRPLN